MGSLKTHKDHKNKNQNHKPRPEPSEPPSSIMHLNLHQRVTLKSDNHDSRKHPRRRPNPNPITDATPRGYPFSALPASMTTLSGPPIVCSLCNAKPAENACSSNSKTNRSNAVIHQTICRVLHLQRKRQILCRRALCLPLSLHDIVRDETLGIVLDAPKGVPKLRLSIGL